MLDETPTIEEVAGLESRTVASGRVRRHPVAAFVARRLAAGLATLLVASAMIFIATNVLPGNVASVVLGRNGTAANVRLLDSRLDLNQPAVERYWHWLAGVLHGDLGQSAVQIAQGARSAPVLSMIGVPFVNSFILAAAALVVLIPISLLLGVAAGVAAGRQRDLAISYTSLILGAFPEFVLGTFLILLFFTALDLLPPVALVNPGTTTLSRPIVLILPTLTLLGVSLGFAVRQLRAGMVEVMRQDYVTVAELNGLSRRMVLSRYALRNALAPSIQVYAQTIQYLVGGIIIVESLFDYPGIGQFLVNAVQTRDITEVESVAILLAAIYIIINIMADLLVVLVVPKLRTSL